MVKSMFAGVSGLRAHQQKMDVIGNNIANVNTWGYKAYSYNFQDSIYTNSIRSSGGETTAGAYGGRNPSQVGYGSQLSSISFQYTGGAPSPTDNDLDCAIDGTGLFLVGGMVNGELTADGIKNSGLYLSRVGIFTVDNNGYLVDAQKNYVYGFALANGTGVPEKPETYATAVIKPQDVEITYTAGATDADPGTYTMNYLGVEVSVTATKSASGIPNFNVDRLTDAWIEKAQAPADAVAGTAAGPLANCDVAINKKSKGSMDQGNNKYPLNFGITVTAKTPGTAGNGAIPADVQTAAGDGYTEGTNFVAGIDAEFNENLSPMQIPLDPDTNEAYKIVSYSISDTGVIVGIDDQNRPITIGQIALIAVENPNGMEKTSGYYFTPGENAGDVSVHKPGGTVGILKSKYLEMANVDLANEFSNMITTQRGFQANSKIITVTDEMLQELVNMKR